MHMVQLLRRKKDYRKNAKKIVQNSENAIVSSVCIVCQLYTIIELCNDHSVIRMVVYQLNGRDDL
jgi:hypothetical protein